jgi:hypothetical protein
MASMTACRNEGVALTPENGKKRAGAALTLRFGS